MSDLLDELRLRAAIAASNDEAPLEAIYLQKAVDEIARLEAKVKRLERKAAAMNWLLSAAHKINQRLATSLRRLRLRARVRVQ